MRTDLKSLISNCSPATLPDPEVVAIAKRRELSPGAKCLLLAEADRCRALGTLAAFLRGARIYPATLSSWRKHLGAAEWAAYGSARRAFPRP